MNVVTRGIRNAFRNKIRTLSIVTIVGLSIGLALCMQVASSAVNQKIESVKAAAGTTISVSSAGVRGFLGGGEPLDEKDIDALSSNEHLSVIDKSVSEQLTSDNSSLKSAIEAGSLGKRFKGGGPSISLRGPDGKEMTPPVLLTGTTDPTKLSSSIGGGSFTLKDGELFDRDSDEMVALVGSSLAEKNDLKVGSTFTAFDKTITVAGIFDAGNTFSNNQVIMPLETAQKLTGQENQVTSASLTVDSIDNLESVTSTVKSALGDSADVTNSNDRAEETIKPLENIKSISMISLVGAVISGAAIILMTMIMIVRERRREIGVIKAIGASNTSVTLQFMSEAATLTTFSAVIGIVFGSLAAGSLTSMLVKSASEEAGPRMGGGPTLGGGPGMIGNINDAVTSVQTQVGWDIIAYGFGAALLIALIGSSLAAFFIAKVRPAEVMRAE